MKNPKHFWNWATDEETGKRILRLDGVIAAQSWLGDEVTPQEFRAELNASKDAVTIWINSEGGDVFAAAAIYAALKEYSGKVTVKIINAFSAASVVAMAGDVVEILPVGMMMIHDPWALAQGNSAEMKATARMLDEVKESIITAYTTKTKLSRKEISRLMSEETWIHAQRAVELGFADRIIAADGQTSSCAASAGMSSRRQMQNALRTALAINTCGAKKISAKEIRRHLEGA